MTASPLIAERSQAYLPLRPRRAPRAGVRKRIGVVVPAFNEGRLLGATLMGLPPWVDLAIVVDDASSDDTRAVAHAAYPVPVRVVSHTRNRGVGASIVTGYRAVLEEGLDIAVVMGGDNQMHPDDLAGLVAPLETGAADYVMGDRLAWPGGWREFPKVRLFGVVGLGVMTRAVTGVRVRDAQCGYTAITSVALAQLPLDGLYPRYGFPNDLLAKVAIAGFEVTTRPVRPVYADERSDLRIGRVVAPLLRISASNALARLTRRG
jgi:glycosyltransferase involved in cell wall biosynthesis